MTEPTRLPGVLAERLAVAAMTGTDGRPRRFGATVVDDARSPEDLARLLVRRLRAAPAGPLDPDAVWLDVEVDGLRVVVVGAECARRPALLLSPREREVADLVALGCTNRRIADDLNISTWTVSTHLRRMFVKLDVTSRAALVAKVSDGTRFRAHSSRAHLVV